MLSLVLVMPLASCGPKLPTPEEVYSTSREAIVKIYSLNERGEPGRSGTGFVVQQPGKDKLKILTNKHLTSKSGVLIVETPSDIWLAQSWSEHPFLDAALIEIPPDKVLSALPLGSAHSIKPGNQVYVIGYPLGNALAVQVGHINAIDAGNFVFSAPFSEGASGSPLLDTKGQVVGLCHSYMPEAQNYNLASPIDLVRHDNGWVQSQAGMSEDIGPYIKKLSQTKKTLHRQLEEWRNIAVNQPEWSQWVGQTMLTREPLSEALEGLLLTVHSIQWSSLTHAAAKKTNLLDAILLAKQATQLNEYWAKHSKNLENANQLQPLPSLPGEKEQTKQLVQSSRKLAEVLNKYLAAVTESKQPDLSPITSALHNYLEHEKQCLAVGLP